MFASLWCDEHRMYHTHRENWWDPEWAKKKRDDVPPRPANLPMPRNPLIALKRRTKSDTLID